MKTSSRVRLGITLAALAFYAVFIFRTSFRIGDTRYFVLFEDAMISMRYARHLASGHGLVWNIGEAPIEGFTNFLWVVWMSVPHALGLSESKISLFIMLSGVAILLATGLIAAKVVRQIVRAPWAPSFVLAATLFNYPLIFWTLRGMEVGALALAVVTLLWLVFENEERESFGRTLAIAFITSAALLLRSDAIVPVGLITLYGLWTSHKKWRYAVLVGTFATSTLLGQMLFRRAYFHESLPNTYFLKLHRIPLSDRLRRGAFVALEVLALHLALPLSLVMTRVVSCLRSARILHEPPQRRMLLLSAVFVAQVAYGTWVGGDAWEWMLYANRYMSVAMPGLIVLVGAILASVLSPGGAIEPLRIELRGRFLSVASATSFIFGALLVALNLAARVFPERGIAATIVFSKTAFAAGLAICLFAFLARMRDARRFLLEMLEALEHRLGRTRTAAGTAIVLSVLVWAPSHALPVGRWLIQNAAQYTDEARYARLGMLLRESTPPDLRIAVAAAGATPYFSGKPTEDLLGKNDRHIAKLALRGVFSPGHDKWDYRYSLGERRADLIVETVDVSADDERYLESLGFETLDNGLRLRRSANVARKDVLGREVTDGAALAAALSELGRALPRGLLPVDLLVVVAFGLLALALTKTIARDAETFLDESLPRGERTLEDDERASLEAANARAILVLDGLRGIAVLAVLTFHFAWTCPGGDGAQGAGLVAWGAERLHEFLWSGWIGVDLFFVLSGYLITRGLVSDAERSFGARLKLFWMRRVLRIFPLYYAVLLGGTILTVALGATWYPGVSYWLYFQNYALAFDREPMRWTAHFWSLAIEEQFYFLWPIVALSVPRRRLVPLTLMLTLGTVLLRAGFTFRGHELEAVRHWVSDEPAGIPYGIAKLVYRMTFTRADGLLLGAFIAVAQREVRHPLARAWRRLRRPALVGASVALAGLYVWARGLNDYDRRIIALGYCLLAVLFASGVSLASEGEMSARMTRLLRARVLVSCGKVSYGMYMFHWPLVVLAVPYVSRVQAGLSLSAQLGVVFAFIVVGITFVWALASLSFAFFETPFLKLKKRFHD